MKIGELFGEFIKTGIDYKALSRTNDLFQNVHMQAGGGSGLDIPFLALLEGEFILQRFRVEIDRIDRRRLDVEDFDQFSANSLENGFGVKVRDQRLLNGVDDAQFGVALFGFSKQALRFFEQTRILHGGTHARSDGLQHTYHRSWVRTPVLEILDGDTADQFTAGQDGDHNRRLGDIRTEGQVGAVLFPGFFGHIVDHQ